MTTPEGAEATGDYLPLRERARRAFWQAAERDRAKRAKVVARVIARAEAHAQAIGLPPSEWRDWGNSKPNTVATEVDGLTILFDVGGRFRVRGRRDLGFEEFGSLAELGRILDWYLPGSQRWSPPEHNARSEG